MKCEIRARSVYLLRETCVGVPTTGSSLYRVAAESLFNTRGILARGVVIHTLRVCIIYNIIPLSIIFRWIDTHIHTHTHTYEPFECSYIILCVLFRKIKRRVPFFKIYICVCVSVCVCMYRRARVFMRIKNKYIA